MLYTHVLWYMVYAYLAILMSCYSRVYTHTVRTNTLYSFRGSARHPDPVLWVVKGGRHETGQNYDDVL